MFTYVKVFPFRINLIDSRLPEAKLMVGAGGADESLPFLITQESNILSFLFDMLSLILLTTLIIRVVKIR